ncbi:MAG: homoserine O-acetyltransferase [Balneolaceae bacterium]|nr:homoserine O-acetyltransferase [Balneolaceae bacterium]
MQHTHTFEKPFVTESGAVIPQPRAAWRSWGKLNQARDNAVVIFHALTGNCEADRWFGGLFGPGGVLNPAGSPDSPGRFVLCINVPGSCYGSSGPRTVNPHTGEPWRASFPEITIRDMVCFQQRVLDLLEITGVELAVGGSMGGMQVLEFCLMDRRARAGVVLAAGAAHSPWAVALNHTQRLAITGDPSWRGGDYPEDDPPRRGLSLARQIAMNSYRAPSDYRRKFGRERRSDGRFQVESYLEYQGDKLCRRFDAVSYLRLSRAMDSHDVGRGRGGLADALSRVQIPVLVAGVSSDGLYPAEEQRELASLLPRGQYTEIDSPHGHDAFLIEFGKMNQIIASFLENQTLESQT